METEVLVVWRNKHRNRNIVLYTGNIQCHKPTLPQQKINLKKEGFPDSTVVKNPPANAGDTGLSPGPGISHMPWSNEAHVLQLLSLRSRAHEPQLLSPHATTTEVHAP